MADGPAAGLAVTDGLLDVAALRKYHLLPSVRGDLLAKLGRSVEARAEFERAAELTFKRGRARTPVARATISFYQDFYAASMKVWWFRAGRAWRGLREGAPRCTEVPDPTPGRSPDSPDRHIHLTARTGTVTPAPITA